MDPTTPITAACGQIVQHYYQAPNLDPIGGAAILIALCWVVVTFLKGLTRQ